MPPVKSAIGVAHGSGGASGSARREAMPLIA